MKCIKKSVFIPKTGGENPGDEKAGNSSILPELADDIQREQPVGGVDDAGLRYVHMRFIPFFYLYLFFVYVFHCILL